jgi:hypothetical protein
VKRERIVRSQSSRNPKLAGAMARRWSETIRRVSLAVEKAVRKR